MHRARSVLPWKRVVTISLVAVLAFAFVGCAEKPAGDKSAAKQGEQSDVVLASTTSTQDSGLFDVLIPAFESANPEYRLKVIAVGTGEALKLGESKDADVLFVHAKADEEKFVEGGFGVEREDVCYNDFVVVGPASDPAGAKGATDIVAAMKTLASGKAPFISRGDDSGTHKKELTLWKASGVAIPAPGAQKWYESTGQGMGETLKIASEKQGYAIADRATYLSMQDALDLVIIREGDTDLLNQYGVIVVTDAANQEGGQAFFDWILSEEGQKVIGKFGIQAYGQQLFVPNAE